VGWKRGHSRQRCGRWERRHRRKMNSGQRADRFRRRPSDPNPQVSGESIFELVWRSFSW
jgi:hypothetical protein